MKENSWLMLEILVQPKHEDLACGLLHEMGTIGLEIRSAPENHSCILAYFPSSTEAAPLQDSFQHIFRQIAPQASLSIIATTAAPFDWVSAAKSCVKKVEAGKHFLFYPSWDRPVDTGGRIAIQIDPQQAFGTGAHESTRLCVELMEKHFTLDHHRCLDVGCGSGILLLALDSWIRHLTGSLPPRAELVGIETDEASVEVAQANVNNSVNFCPIQIQHQRVESFSVEPFDFIFANLISGAILKNMDRLDNLLRSGGVMILSGILVSEKPAMTAAVVRQGWPIKETAVEGEWLALAVHKPG
jgi:ribosomal protein L11 methyltransferase